MKTFERLRRGGLVFALFLGCLPSLSVSQENPEVALKKNTIICIHKNRADLKGNDIIVFHPPRCREQIKLTDSMLRNEYIEGVSGLKDVFLEGDLIAIHPSHLGCFAQLPDEVLKAQPDDLFLVDLQACRFVGS